MDEAKVKEAMGQMMDALDTMKDGIPGCRFSQKFGQGLMELAIAFIRLRERTGT